LVVGVREGDVLSTLLFNLYTDKFIMNVKMKSTGTIYNRKRQCLVPADDVTISECGM
jgi:hypothetical protein